MCIGRTGNKSNRGNGRIFKRRESALYWCAYYLRGDEYKESTCTTNPDQAKRFLKRRIKEIGADQIEASTFVGPQQERMKVGNLLDALEDDYKLRGKDSPQFKAHMKQIRRLSEKGNARRGFFTNAAFRLLRQRLPEHLRDFCEFGYLTGWRKGEIASLHWEDVDGDLVLLRGENAKNGHPRSVTLSGDLADSIERMKCERKYEGREHWYLSEYVFHINGRPIGEFRKSWATACMQPALACINVLPATRHLGALSALIVGADASTLDACSMTSAGQQCAIWFELEFRSVWRWRSADTRLDPFLTGTTSSTRRISVM